MGAIEYVDGVRDSRTGAPRNAAGPGADTLNNAFTQTLGGANMVETASQERTAFYARTFAETGVKAAMQRIDELVCKHQTKKTSLKLRNKWFEFNPADWKAKIDCTVGVGLGTNNQAIKTGQLSSLMTQVYLPIATLQQGLNGPVLDVKSVSHAGKKLVQSMGFKDADSFFPDPESIPAPAAPQQQPSPQEITAQASVKTTQMKNDHDLAKTHLTLQSQERLEQLRQAVARELGYAKIAVDNKAIDAEVALKHSQHATDTAFRNHDAHLATRESNRADAQAQHDAQHDTAQLTQTGSHFAAEHGLKHATLAHTKADSNRTFGAANPNYQDPEIVPEPPKPRKMISMGVSHDADGILAATHRHFDDGSMETIPITRGSTPKPGAAA
jgi:hypothetical protein